MTQEYYIEKLEAFLQENDIPKIKANPKTFLGIAKQPHYENVLSNIYAFYMQPEEEHNLKDLFIISLAQLIRDKKDKGYLFTDSFDVETEFHTDKGGRIDLLLQGGEEAIIIENKVYHYLDNDLADYWNTIQVANKVGIVLSLNQIGRINHPHFINITHLEYLQKIFENIGSYLLGANEKYLVFLKDFYQNIQNLSNTMETGNLHFFYENRKKIDDIVKLRESTSSFIKHEVEQSQNLIKIKTDYYSVRGFNETRLRYFLSPNNKDLYFTILFEGLLNNKMELMLIIEMGEEALTEAESFKSIEFTPEEEKIIKSEFYKQLKNYWAHFAFEKHTLNEEDILNLRHYISDKINNGVLSSIFNKLDEKLSSNRLEAN